MSLGNGELPSPQSRVEYVGPIETNVVVVDGWRVPFLEAHSLPGGEVRLVLDRRYGLELTVAEAERVVPFLADAIAVGLGFASHPRVDLDPVPQGPYRRVHRVDTSHDSAG